MHADTKTPDPARRGLEFCIERAGEHSAGTWLGQAVEPFQAIERCLDRDEGFGFVGWQQLFAVKSAEPTV